MFINDNKWSFRSATDFQIGDRVYVVPKTVNGLMFENCKGTVASFVNDFGDVSVVVKLDEPKNGFKEYKFRAFHLEKLKGVVQCF